MRYLFSLVFIGAFYLTSFSQFNSRPKEPQDLGEAVFKCFHDEDYKTYKMYFFTDVDCDVMTQISTPDSMKNELNKSMKMLTDGFQEYSKRNFEEILSIGRQNKIKWDRVELINIKCNLDNDLYKNFNIQSAEILLFCKYKGKEFQLRLNYCHKSDA